MESEVPYVCTSCHSVVWPGRRLGTGSVFTLVGIVLVGGAVALAMPGVGDEQPPLSRAGPALLFLYLLTLGGLALQKGIAALRVQATCPTCEHDTLIPTTSPRGKAIARDVKAGPASGL